MTFSPNVATLKPSATLALAARARALRAEGVPVVDLSAGEPKFGTPEYAARAGIESIRAGKTGYPPTQGLPELREAVAAYLAESTAAGGIDPAQVLVSAGVKQALFNVCYSLFGEGDEVLVLAPYWPSYPTIVELAGATPVVVDTTWDEAFLATPDQLEEARTSRTRGLLLNSPGNPTGSVYDLEALTSIASWAEEHGIWVISDEIYRRLRYENPVPSLLDVPELTERAVHLDGVSKSFCMPGWRIGYAVGPRDLIKKAADLQSQTTSGAVGPSQYAATAALGQSELREDWVRQLTQRLAGLRDRGLEGLGALSALDVRSPPGGLYFYTRLRDPATGSLDVAERLLKEEAVACIPGEPFGSPGHLRFNFAVEEEVLEEGLARIRSFFST